MGAQGSHGASGEAADVLLLFGERDDDIVLLVDALEDTEEGFCSVDGSVQPDLHVPAEAGLDVQIGLELTLDAGGGDLRW